MFLAEGRLAFTGTPQKTIDFFKNIGMEAPADQNPACYLMSSLSGDGKRSTKWISDQFAVTPAAIERDSHISAAMMRGRENGGELWRHLGEQTKFQQSFKTFMFIICLLTYRNLLNVKRNPSIQILRVVQKIVSYWRSIGIYLIEAITILIDNRRAVWPLLLWIAEPGPVGNSGGAGRDLYHNL